jgi:diguanylate cyclase (GGDEF)-like protein/PAS domain S-box-containing protein
MAFGNSCICAETRERVLPRTQVLTLAPDPGNCSALLWPARSCGGRLLRQILGQVSTKQTNRGRSAITAESARSALLAQSAPDLVNRLIRLASLGLRAPVAMIGVVDGNCLVLAGQQGVPEPWSSSRELPLSASFCRFVTEVGNVLVVDDAARHALTYAVPRLEGFSRVAYCGAPIVVAGEIVAVLSVTDEQPRQWTDGEIMLLRDLAAAAPRDLELALVAGAAARPDEDQVGVGVGALHEDWAELRSREARYRALFEESLTPLFVMTADSRIMEVNRAFEELLGRERGELYRLRLSELAHEATAFDVVLDELVGKGSVEEVEVVLRRGTEPLHCVATVSARTTEHGASYHGSLRDVTAAKRTQAELIRTALHDPLTELPNRIVFMDRLERLLKHAKRNPEYKFAVLFVDLDDFKRVNDLYGHQMGDHVLVGVARRLESCVREGDTIARLGGDEFGILLDTVQDAASVTFVVDRIRESLSKPYNGGGRTAGTTASIGIALNVNAYDTAGDLLRDADAAMYRAKLGGRNDYVIFDHDMHDRAVAQRQLEEDLRKAVSRHELTVLYHPVVELDRGSMTGLEALIRWSHPQRGVLLPADFMPLAEQTGVIIDIGWWILRESCRQLRAWQLEYPDAAFKLTMSVNLSAKQFVHPELVDRIDEILAETQLNPRYLRLDLTEGVVTQNPQLAARLLQELRERGIQICIDDFGTGYSSLRQLREFPISMLKIDRSFIRQLGGDSGSSDVIRTIIALGRSMAIEAVAEGVETPEQLEQLRQLGTRFAQGYLFSLPLDSQAATSLLAERTDTPES